VGGVRGVLSINSSCLLPNENSISADGPLKEEKGGGRSYGRKIQGNSDGWTLKKGRGGGSTEPREKTDGTSLTLFRRKLFQWQEEREQRTTGKFEGGKRVVE